jgi:hypothetical protein
MPWDKVLKAIQYMLPRRVRKIVYCTKRYLDGKRATLISVLDDIGVLAYKKVKVNLEHLAG